MSTRLTEHPEATWVTQQLRESFPFDTTPRYAILDRDGKYGYAVPTALQSLGVEPVRTAPRSPWQNPFIERLIGSIRREYLDPVVIFNARHLRRVLTDYLVYHFFR